MQTNLALYVPFALHEVGSSLLHQLSDIADGLNYLHSRNVVHGDLKGVRESRKNRPNLLTNVLAKHSCQRYRPRTYHRLRPLRCHFGHRTNRVHSRGPCHTMGRTGDPGQGSRLQQGSRHLFVWDGCDRGMPRL